jgi:ribosome-associated translation inhibitor RaiA
MTSRTMPSSTSRAGKRAAGRTSVDSTPLAVRTTGIQISESLEEQVRARVSRKLAKFAVHIERVTVRFEDENGPRGGVDTTCRIKIVVSGMPSVVSAERRSDAERAFAAAFAAAERTLRRQLERRGVSRGAVRKTRAVSAVSRRARNAHPSPEGSLVGRRVGRAAENIDRALERPEKLRRDAYVDTAAPGTSATDRKAGGGATARRNTRKNPRSGHALEDSAQDRPSRKSTRKSRGRVKRDDPKRRAVKRKRFSPKAKATRARAR